MSNIIYLRLEGSKQGLISQGCSNIDSIGNKSQIGHEDQIQIHSFSHSITREQNSNHHPIIIQKPIDKSSPLLGVAISENEIMDGVLDFYRTNQGGFQELYYTLKFNKATLTEMTSFYPNALTHNGSQAQETLSLKYQSIMWYHRIAGTSGFSVWEDRVY